MATTNADPSVRCAICDGPLENPTATSSVFCELCHEACHVADIMNSYDLYFWQMCYANKALKELKRDPEAFAFVRRFTALLRPEVSDLLFDRKGRWRHTTPGDVEVWKPAPEYEPEVWAVEPRDSESEDGEPGEYGPLKPQPRKLGSEDEPWDSESEDRDPDEFGC